MRKIYSKKTGNFGTLLSDQYNSLSCAIPATVNVFALDFNFVNLAL